MDLRTLVAVCVLAVAGCKVRGPSVRATQPGDGPSAPESDDPEVKASIAENCLKGAPVLELNFGETTTVGRPGYALGHSNALKIPLWVCEHVTKADLTENCHRGDWFKADPKVPTNGRAQKSDYKRSGFDRGHMAASDDFQHSCDEMKESFFLSNMSPQVGSGMNQHVWKYLEQQVRAWVVKYDEAWVVTGPVFLEDSEGLYVDSTIGAGEVGVPAAFYKLVVVKEADKYSALGFILENRKYPTKRADHGDFSAFATTVDDVEERTGIDFFPEFPSNIEGALESATPNPGAW